MAALQGIKRRIRSVTSTRQITKAMQLVAASKLRRAQEAATGPQAYIAAAREVLAGLSGSSNAQRHPLYQVRPVRQALTIVIAGDRGMAGAYNSNIFKALGRHLHALNVPQQAICIGRHAMLQVARASDIDELAAYLIDDGDADIALAQPVLREATQLYETGQVDAVHIISTRFVSTIKQEANVRQLLPVTGSEGEATEREFEPNPEELLDYATRRVLEAEVLQAILEARASEQAARMMAMMNATDNAKDLIEDLTLTYNDARQAAITQELAEISGGAEAISQAGV
ncbi:MAG TPA: ATP synthase F1 subunit gamma [Candidatus Saccharimonadia bacterium]|nr:ATP synthase F1 subunit gamma [Candidatus Saccharimonadia bacterium]